LALGQNYVAPVVLFGNSRCIGGVQAGYNWQVNTFLYGLEADADWLSGTASRTLTGFPVIATGDFMTNSVRAEFLGTVRGRLGAVFNQALLFVTGGLAIGTVKTSGSFGHFGGSEIETASETTTRAGWTIGGGLEYAFAPLGNFDLTLPSSPDGAPDSTTVHNRYTDNIVRVGLNYRFWGEPWGGKSPPPVVTK
jgi:outer membrane immunogenic protein